MFSIIPYRSNRVVRNDNRSFFDPFADDFFRAFFGDAPSAGDFRVDVEENGDKYVMSADLPGVSKDDVHVTIKDGVMTISAAINEDKEKKDKNYVCRERRCGTFTRSFNLDGIDETAISGGYKDGVLTLNLPKLAETKPEAREISIA